MQSKNPLRTWHWTLSVHGSTSTYSANLIWYSTVVHIYWNKFVWKWTCAVQIYVPQGSTVFGDRGFWKIVSLDEIMRAESPCWDYHPYKRPESLFSVSPMRGSNRKAAVCKLGRELSPRTKSADPLTLDFLTSRTMKNKCVPCKSPNLCYFVILSSLNLLNIFKIHFHWGESLLSHSVAISSVLDHSCLSILGTLRSYCVQKAFEVNA